MDERTQSLDTPDRNGAPDGQLSGEPILARSTAGASAPPPGWRAPFASLANKDFRYLWLGMLALAAGVEMELIAIGYLVYDITGSALRLGIVEAAFAFPTLLFSLFGGVLADRMDKRLIIQISQSLEVVVGFTVAVLILTDSITWTHLLIMALIEGSLFAFMMPARLAIVPRLVSSNQLTNAIAMNTAAFSAMTLLSPVLAGGIYGLAGPGAVFLTLSTFKVVSVALTTLVRRVPPIENDQKSSVLLDIKEGLNYVWRTRLVLMLLVLGLISFMLAWPFHTLIPVFIKDIYGLGPEAMGLMLAFLGAGALVGSMFVATAGRWNRGLVMIGGGFVTSIGLFLVAGIPVLLRCGRCHAPRGSRRGRNVDLEQYAHDGENQRHVQGASLKYLNADDGSDAAGSAAGRLRCGSSRRADHRGHPCRAYIRLLAAIPGDSEADPAVAVMVCCRRSAIMSA